MTSEYKKNYDAGRMFFPAFFIWLFFLPATLVWAEEYLLVSNPAALTMYNRFEQRVDPSSVGIHHSNFPFLIESANDTLSDGFTACYRVSVGGQNYFLVQQGRGQLQNKENLGEVRLIRNVHSKNDSVEILLDRQIKMYSGLRWNTESSNETILKAGEKVTRVFRSGVYWYVQRHNAVPVFGWIRFRNTGWKIIQRSKSTNNELNEAEVQIVKRIVEKANDVMQRSFNYFDPSKQAPRWNILRQSQGLIVSLAPKSLTDQFLSSTEQLAHRINAQLGYKPAVNVDGTEIIIGNAEARP